MPPPPVMGIFDIRSRAVEFAREWRDACNEDADAKSFWDAFFNVFGISRHRVANFEFPVRQPDGNTGYIDLLWRGILLVEHKSRGRDLESAFSQAKGYFHGLKDRDLPKFVIVSDFNRFRLYDLQQKRQHDFTLAELPDNIDRLGFMSGWHTTVRPDKEKLADIEAAELLGKLHDELKDSGYTGHALEVLLVRLLFCMFAEDNALFERRQFQDYVESRSQEDGSDLGAQLNQLFEVLNTPVETRNRSLSDILAAFPYVNGEVFSETLPTPAFTTRSRERLLDCCAFDWTAISPEVFGSLFQSIMSPDKRRELGAHYTSETNILKALRPLFLDALEAELEAARRNPRALRTLHDKLGAIRLLDPACGCGNFLVVAYRELRKLEHALLLELHKVDRNLVTDISLLSKVDVDQMAGIELEEFPAQVARVALWLTDHQANRALSLEFGKYFVRLPLKKSARILNDNALRVDWGSVVPLGQLSYIVGNPPFAGHQWRNPDQVRDMDLVWGDDGKFGRLDYVTAWYRKAADILTPSVKCAFVSTNSISQGEQVGILWAVLFQKGIKIHFAHRTFAWDSEARGVAQVHCVIIGFGLSNPTEKKIYDYDRDPSGKAPTITICSNISPYLIAGSDLILPSRSNPPSGMPKMTKGSQPTDGGNLLLSDQERAQLLSDDPESGQWIRPYMGGEDYINGKSRWCLWLKNAKPSQIRHSPFIMARIEGVRASRLESPTKSVREMATSPAVFTQDRQPTESYLVVPEVSSELRQYIPMGFLPPEVIASNKLQMIPGATTYHFGIMSSTMHMAWVKVVAGRLKSDFSYSPAVYNNFPWPSPTPAQKQAIEECAQAVLDAREVHKGSTLADLYDPLTMPANLAQAHRALDRAVEKAYTRETLETDADRVAFLFKLYEQLTSALAPAAPARRRRKA